jgi:trehalose 6-phosphate phosphatase
MKHLFSPDGEAALLAIMKKAPLLAFDFDGTLAPIVVRPEDARVPMPVSHRLKTLEERLPLAVISGRRVNDVLGRLGFRAAHVIGNHGAEDPMSPAAPGMERMLDALRLRLRADRTFLAKEGIYVEDKGLSMALHYRLAKDRNRAALMICTLLDDFSANLNVFGGKMVVNVLPRGADDKGQALLKLMDRAKRDAVIYVGDDVNDEPAFACAAPRGLSVRIGRDHAGSKAQFFLDATADVPMMLDMMVQILRET